ncbi:putative membrane protein [Marinobacter pelagius]|uniref:Putative membrane protein n=1 Tax=Marinobacter pelagius TaxID=379482 RepID=A0A366GFH5_9GAMM|nr:putative membrane protein [Marinobacter pelagius]
MAILPLLIVLLLGITTLMIDSARLLSLRSEMQSQANAAATAAADQARACSGPDASFLLMQNKALGAAQALGFSGDSSELNVQPGLVRPGVGETDRLVFIEKDPASELDQTNAARVTYTRSERLSFLLPEALFEPVQLSVSAVARKEVVATVSAAGSTATVQNGLLGNLLGVVLGNPGYSLDATSLNSLSNTLLGVGDLLAALGVDTVVEMTNLPLSEVLEAVTGLVGGVASPLGAVVDDLVGAVGVDELNAGAVFQVVGGAQVPADTNFPVYDFVTSVVLNSVKALNESTAGLASVTLDSDNSPVIGTLMDSLVQPLLGDIDLTLGLWVDEPPKIVIGPARMDANGEPLTTVASADIRLATDIGIQLATSEITGLLSALTLGIVDIDLLEDIRVPLAVAVGGGEARLIGADCARGNDNTASFDFETQSSVADIQTGYLDTSSGVVEPADIEADLLKLRLSLLNIIDILNVGVCLNAGLQVELPKAETFTRLESYDLYCPDGQCESVLLSGSSDAPLQGLDVSLGPVSLECDSDSGVLGTLKKPSEALVNGLLPPITGLVEVVTRQVLGSVVSPLLSGLGADLGGMSVKVLSASQAGAQLVREGP